MDNDKKEVDFVKFGSIGGKKTAALYGKEHYSKAGKKGVEGKLKKYGQNYYKDIRAKGIAKQKAAKEEKERQEKEANKPFAKLVKVLTGG